MPSVQAVLESRLTLPGDGPTDGYFYTNRCGNAKQPGCNRAITKLEILAAMGINPARSSICPCGSNGFRSSNFKWWEELFLPRSWKMWWAIRNKAIPPPPTKGDVITANQSMMAGAVASMDSDDEDIDEEVSTVQGYIDEGGKL